MWFKFVVTSIHDFVLMSPLVFPSFRGHQAAMKAMRAPLASGA